MSDNPFEGVFTIKRLASFVAGELGLPVEKVLSPNRKRDFALARALVAHFAHRRGLSYKQIGRSMQRDHSTIIHSVRSLQGWMTLYPDAAALFAKLSDLFEQSKAHHAHIYAWRQRHARPVAAIAAVSAARQEVPSIASKAELIRFAAVRKNLESDERNRREGSAKLSAALARAGGWR